MRPLAIFLLICILAASNALAYDYNSDLWKQISNPGKMMIYIYTVDGDDLNSIKSEMLKSGPEAENGRRHYAVANWRIEWSWPHILGKPDYTAANVDTFIKITLPYPSNDKFRNSEIWKNYQNTMVKHELQHVKHASLGVMDIESLIYNFPPEITPQDANKAVHKLVTETRRLDIQYDTDTNHGKSEGLF